MTQVNDSARIAGELGGGLFANEPKGDVVAAWKQHRGSGPAYVEIPLAWAPDEKSAVRAILEKNRWSLVGDWKVHSELPNPVNFDANSMNVTAEQAKQKYACGPDVQRHLEITQPFIDAGFDHIVTQNAGPDPDGFMTFFQQELAEPLRALKPSL